jgi:hypothetical protein
VPVVIVVLLAGLLLVLASGQPNAERKSGAERVPRAGNGWWLLGALLVAVVLLRFGLGWLALLGGTLLALLRGLAPLLRLLPLYSIWRQQRQSANASGQGYRDQAYAGSGAHGANPGGAASARPARMSRHEALEVLGLDERATREDVQREYRRLIKRLHPDLGGSTYLTAKLNEARDVLS